jgi:hypothetical protein
MPSLDANGLPSHAELDVAAGRSHGAGRHQGRPSRLSPSGPPRCGRRGARPRQDRRALPGIRTRGWEINQPQVLTQLSVTLAHPQAHESTAIPRETCGQAGMHCCLPFLSSTGIWKLPPAQSRPCFCAVFQLSLSTGVFRCADATPLACHTVRYRIAHGRDVRHPLEARRRCDRKRMQLSALRGGRSVLRATARNIRACDHDYALNRHDWAWKWLLAGGWASWSAYSHGIEEGKDEQAYK